MISRVWFLLVVIFTAWVKLAFKLCLDSSLCKFLPFGFATQQSLETILTLGKKDFKIQNLVICPALTLCMSFSFGDSAFPFLSPVAKTYFSETCLGSQSLHSSDPVLLLSISPNCSHALEIKCCPT